MTTVARQVDTFYYSQPSKSVRYASPWLQRRVSEGTSNRRGLSDSRRTRHRRSNSQVPQQRSLLWRHRWDQERSAGNTGQSFDPIRGISREGKAFMSEWRREIVGCHFVFQRQKHGAKGEQAASAPSLFNKQPL